jgi:hypothetical protein
VSDDDQVPLVVHGRRQMEHLRPGNDTYAAAGTYTVMLANRRVEQVGEHDVERDGGVTSVWGIRSA